MPELSKQALKVANNTEFPNNNNGFITPSRLRSFNVDMIDSTVNQAQYTTDSSSWNADITQLEADVQALETFSASLSGTFVTEGELAAATGSLINSINTKLDTASFNAFTASVTGVATGSLLVTASAVSNVITFTKGDASTFDVTVADTTNLSSLNAFTQSANSRLNNLESNSASVNTSITNINAYTASNNTKWQDLGSKSGSWITESETGSFARYDVSNPWSADQTFTNISATSASVSRLIASGLKYPTADNGTLSFIQSDGAGNLSLQYVKTLYQNIRNKETSSIVLGTPLFVSGATGDNADVYIAEAANPLRFPATLIAGDTTLAASATGKGIVSGDIKGVNTTGYAPGTVIYLGATGGWTDVRPTGSTTQVQILGVVTKEGNNGEGLVMNQLGTELPNIQEGYAWVGNADGTPIEVATASFGGGAATDISSLNAFTASQYVSNSFFATTGSNTFIGVQTLLDSGSNQSILAPFSGGFALVAKGLETTIANVTSSQVATAATGNVNLAFKTTNIIPEIIISGSGNIFQLANFSTAAGFKRQLTSNNFLNAAIPSLTSSMAFPVNISSNIGPMTITMRGPVSASQWTVASNVGAGVLNLGGLSATFHATNHIGNLNVSSNTLNGTINFIANQSLINGTSTITNNDYKGGGRLAASSSAIAFTRNTIAGNNNQFHNQYFSGSLGTGSVTFQDLIVYGDQNQVYFVGSAPTVQAAPSFISSTILGYENRVTIDGGASKYMAATHLLGNGLIVSASTPIGNTNGMGSLFAGRWNANDSIRNNSGEEIFVVGTGTSTSARKTGFLIDSGSNTFVEGTFNVSGSTSLNGELYLTGALSASNVLITGDLTVNPTTSTKLNGNTDIGANIYIGNAITMNTPGIIAWVGGVGVLDQYFSGSVDSRLKAAATTGSNSFTGDQYISGAVYVSGAAAAIDLDTVNGFISLYNYDEGTSVSTNISSATASLSLTAFGDQASIEDGGTKWWYATNDGQGNYSSLHSERDIVITGSFTASLQEGYVWVGDGNGVSTTVATSSFGGGGGVSFPYSGSVEITGSVKVQPITLSVASNTASINMQDSNFFILNLPTASTTHISFTNITPGESINLLVSQSAAASTGSVSFAPNILFANGTEYQATSTGSAKDIVSFISFNTAEVFATQIKNLL